MFFTFHVTTLLVTTSCPNACALAVDITDEDAIKSLASTAGELFEEISVLVNNAGEPQHFP